MPTGGAVVARIRTNMASALAPLDHVLELVRQWGGPQRHQLPRGDETGAVPVDARDGGAAGLGGTLGPLNGQPDPGTLLQQARGLRERGRGRGPPVIAARPSDMDMSATPSLASRGARPCPPVRAVIPGTRHGDQAEDRVEGLVPLAGEDCLVAPALGTRWPQSVASSCVSGSSEVCQLIRAARMMMPVRETLLCLCIVSIRP